MILPTVSLMINYTQKYFPFQQNIFYYDGNEKHLDSWRNASER